MAYTALKSELGPPASQTLLIFGQQAHSIATRHLSFTRSHDTQPLTQSASRYLRPSLHLAAPKSLTKARVTVDTGSRLRVYGPFLISGRCYANQMSTIRRSVLVDGVWTQETDAIRHYLGEQHRRRNNPLPPIVSPLYRIKERKEMKSNRQDQSDVLEQEELEELLKAERGVLERFFKATWGWRVVLNWMAEDVTTWHGLQTDSLGRLVHLSLSGNNTIGDLPAELGQLKSLQTLDLSVNKLSGDAIVTPIRNLIRNGSIPKEWDGLSSLIELNLSHNRISGVITGTLRKLSCLRCLDLTDNWLHGAFPAWLDGLGSLQVLRTGMNDLVDAIPTTLVVSGVRASVLLIGLTEVCSPYNQLAGPLPSAIGNLANLITLDLESNQLSGPIPPSVGQLASLTSLNLRWNDLTGSIPESIGGMASLRVLRLNHNKLTGPLPLGLAKLGCLEELNLAGNVLEGAVPDCYSQLESLQLVALLWNELEVNAPGQIGDGLRAGLRQKLPPSCKVICVVEDADAEVIKAEEAQHESMRKQMLARKDRPLNDDAGGDGATPPTSPGKSGWNPLMLANNVRRKLMGGRGNKKR